MDCDDALRRQIKANLDAFDAVTAGADDAHHAAVAVTVTDVGHGADLPGLPSYTTWQSLGAVVLTRRSASLRRHAGQWAFPGGRLDGGETPVEAALREMHEEVAVKLGPDAVLGRLDDFVTRSGFVMTPIVVWAGPELEMWPDPREVASVHRIPVTELLRPDAPLLEPAPDGVHPVLRMPVGDDDIAAPTAAVLYQFREVCLLGRHTRVAHFEQPRFAWR